MAWGLTSQAAAPAGRCTAWGPPRQAALHTLLNTTAVSGPSTSNLRHLKPCGPRARSLNIVACQDRPFEHPPFVACTHTLNINYTSTRCTMPFPNSATPITSTTAAITRWPPLPAMLAPAPCCAPLGSLPPLKCLPAVSARPSRPGTTNACRQGVFEQRTCERKLRPRGCWPSPHKSHAPAWCWPGRRQC